MASSVTEETPVADSSNTLAPVGEEQYVKHPLHNEWSWWFFKNDKGHDWKDNLKFITTFGSVEDFWAVYNHIQPVSSLPTGCDYSLFKKGIEPMWEDTANRKGGRWLLQTEKKQRPMLDHYWMEMLLLLVGETLGDDADEVCGIVVQVRTKADKLAIWTRNAQNKDVILRIGQKFKEVLNLPPQRARWLPIASRHKHKDWIHNQEHVLCLTCWERSSSVFIIIHCTYTYASTNCRPLFLSFSHKSFSYVYGRLYIECWSVVVLFWRHDAGVHSAVHTTGAIALFWPYWSIIMFYQASFFLHCCFFLLLKAGSGLFPPCTACCPFSMTMSILEVFNDWLLSRMLKLGCACCHGQLLCGWSQNCCKGLFRKFVNCFWTFTRRLCSEQPPVLPNLFFSGSDFSRL